MKKITLYISIILLLFACGSEQNPEPVESSFLGEADGAFSNCTEFITQEWEGIYEASDPNNPFDLTEYEVELELKTVSVTSSGTQYRFTIKDFGGYSQSNPDFERDIDVIFDEDREVVSLPLQSLNLAFEGRELLVVDTQDATFDKCDSSTFKLFVNTYHNVGFSANHVITFTKQ